MRAISSHLRRAAAPLAACGLLAAAPLTPPTSGTGAFSPKGGVLAAAKAPRLATLGAQVVRASSAPSLGARGWIIELHTVDQDWAEGTVTFLRTTRNYGDWSVTGSMPARLSAFEWTRLEAAVDRLLARGQHDEATPNEVLICADGPNYVVERRSRAGERWMRSGCITSDPTGEIVDLVASAALEGWCDILRAPDACRDRRSASFQRERTAATQH